jgi:hypothetical protein
MGKTFDLDDANFRTSGEQGMFLVLWLTSFVFKARKYCLLAIIFHGHSDLTLTLTIKITLSNMQWLIIPFRMGISEVLVILVMMTGTYDIIYTIRTFIAKSLIIQ